MKPRWSHHLCDVPPVRAPGVDLLIRLGAGFTEGFQEPKPVGVVTEEGFAPVAPVHHVVS
jgi:hypothetical protein